MGKLVAILFSDIKGSGQLTREQAICFKRKVEPIILKQVVESVKSDSIKYYNTWGDAYLFVLDDPKDAVNAALTLRDEFRKLDSLDCQLPEDMNIRCSLHAGDVVIEMFKDPVRGGETKDIVGENVVISARVEPVTPPGRVWATEKFKSMLSTPPAKVRLDPLGLIRLSKRWGAWNLYDIRRDGDEEYHDNRSLLKETFDEKYLPITLKKKGGIYSLHNYEEVSLFQKVMALTEWSIKIEGMQEIIMSEKEDGEISNVGAAVGVQNFLFDGDKLLLAGVRTKGKVDEWQTGFSLGVGAINTGYQALRDAIQFEKTQGKNFHDAFHVIGPSIHKESVIEESEVDDIISKRSGRNRCVIEFGGTRYVALIFVNTSRVFPRFEIGICKYIDIQKLNYDEYISPFGQDEYAKGEEEGNYWLWINDGVIHSRSFASSKYIPCFRENKMLEGKKAILIRNDIKKYGFLEKYVPFVSDEILCDEEEVFNASPFTSPARSLLELF